LDGKPTAENALAIISHKEIMTTIFMNKRLYIEGNVIAVRRTRKAARVASEENT
jgi:hypothetical protein